MRRDLFNIYSFFTENIMIQTIKYGQNSELTEDVFCNSYAFGTSSS